MTDEVELNDRIRDYCRERNVAFKPWEWPQPWEICDGEPSPYLPASQSAGAVWWPKSLALRAKIIKALRATDEPGAS